MLESNGNAPVSTRNEFEANVLLEGQALLKDLEARNPRSPTPLTGFAAEMDRTGSWERVPLVMGAVGATGPVDQPFFEELVGRMRQLLRAAGTVDAVFL